MARSRRKSGGCTSGRFKLKKMGKGMSAHRPKLGYRPRSKPKQDEKPERDAGESSGDQGNAQ